MSEPQDTLALGFLQDTDTWLLRSKFFPSKVGGFPSWLVLEDLPSPSDLSCSSCSSPMTFLCQIYIPLEDKDYAFHRSLFVFVCSKGKCSKEDSVKTMRVFRSQLHKDNKFYSSEPPSEDEESSLSPSAADYNQLCVMCGAVGNEKCGQCSKASYCHRSHQRSHWSAEHKLKCKQMTDSNFSSYYLCTSANDCIFPEAELILEVMEESYKESEPEEEENEETLPEDNESGEENQDDEIESLEKISAKETDETFRRFEKIMALEEDQVVRYQRNGSPLFCSNVGKVEPEEVKECPHCLQPRQFEFQILPQMLTHLKVDEAATDTLDWGTLLIYTCTCDFGNSYTSEQIFRQNYSF